MQTNTMEQTISSLNICKEVDIDAPLAAAFEALLEQMGPGNATPQGPMPMKIEAWPGGHQL